MKTVLITGASRGIGKATAKLFAEKGYNVLIHFNNSCDAASDLVENIRNNGRSCEAFRADLSVTSEVAALADYAQKIGIDVLVNNAGVSLVGLYQCLTAEAAEKLMRVDLYAPMELTKLILPSMIGKKSGSIVNVSSMWGQVGASTEVHYSAAKAGLIGFTKALAKEVALSGIRVNCVCPGVIDTDMNSNLSAEDMKALAEEIPMGRIGTAEEVAECIFFLADSAAYVTGQILSPNGGLVM